MTPADEPMFELPQEPPAPEPKAGVGGWIGLFLILAVMIGGQLYEYLDRKDSKESAYFRVSTQYRAAVLSREFSRRFAKSEAIEEPADTALSDVVAEVAGDRKKEASASRIYVSARHEQGKEIKPEDLALLKASKKKEERSFAAVYEAKTLSLDRAEELAKTFPKQGFTYRMARLHALEKAGDKKARSRIIPDSETYKPLIGVGLILCAGLAGGVLLVVYFVVRAAGKWKPLGHPAGVLTAAQANFFAGRAALMLLAYNVLGPLFMLGLRPILRPEAAGALAEVGTIFFAVWLLVDLKRHAGMSFVAIPRGERRVLPDILWGIGGAMANIPLFLCIGVLGDKLFSGLPEPEHPISIQLQLDQSLPTFILFAALAAVLAPVFEEIVFRFSINPAMERLLGGPAIGILGTNLLFAAIHPTGIPAWPALAMIGAMSSMLAYQRKSLLPCIVFHATHNLSLLILTVLIY